MSKTSISIYIYIYISLYKHLIHFTIGAEVQVYIFNILILLGSCILYKMTQRGLLKVTKLSYLKLALLGIIVSYNLKNLKIFIFLFFCRYLCSQVDIALIQFEMIIINPGYKPSLIRNFTN